MKTQFEIDDTERALLVDILTKRLESLREETQHTDTPSYKDGLKVDRATLQKLINKISSDMSKSAAAAK